MSSASSRGHVDVVLGGTCGHDPRRASPLDHHLSRRPLPATGGENDGFRMQLRHATAVDEHQYALVAVTARLGYERGRQNCKAGFADHMDEAPRVLRSRQLLSKPEQTEPVVHALLQDSSRMVLPLYQNCVRPAFAATSAAAIPAGPAPSTAMSTFRTVIAPSAPSSSRPPG